MQNVAQRTANMCTVSGKADMAGKWEALCIDCNLVGLLSPRTLVLAPTSEIAWQVAGVAKSLEASCCPVVGGVDPERQRELLRKEAPDSIVATPGRLCALCGQFPSSTRRRIA